MTADNLRLPAIISDNMVLQCDRPMPVWGYADPGRTVTVSFRGQTCTATAGADGRWRVDLAPTAAGGPFELAVTGARTLTIRNVLVGEVWLGSGQSNMQMTLSPDRVVDGAAEIAAADYPRLRLFTVRDASAAAPQDDVHGRWIECSPATATEFSATAYFFGRELHRTLGKPVGLILTAEGGSPAESWTSREALAAVPELRILAERRDRLLLEYPEKKAGYDRAVAKFNRRRETLQPYSLRDEGWEKPELDEADWRAMDQPMDWDRAGLFMDGVAWLRRIVNIPAAWEGRPLCLSLGPIEDDDVTYFNGVRIGGSPPPILWPLWTQPRRYTIPGTLVKAGRAVIAIRVTDRGIGAGGLAGGAADLTLRPWDEESGSSIPLAGPWRYRIAELRHQAPLAIVGPDSIFLPTGLFNARIAPLIPYAIRGAIWYQGEANAWRAEQYRILFPTLIRDWRARWGEGDFPFLFVQLPALRAPSAEPADSDWPELREAQAMALRLPNTGMAVAIDLGDEKELHPPNKRDVGRRLARWALNAVYGRDILRNGPLFHSAGFEGRTMRLTFDYTGGGLVARGGGPLKGFAVAGADRKFVWAEARIDGDTVVLSSDRVSAPVAARYAWADNPVGANLYNTEGLPAAPFRTDDWPGITAGRR